MTVPPAQPGHGEAPSGIVSLTTDFGLTEPFVGLVKAKVLASCPGARIVDLTHGIPAFSTEAAAFWVERSCHDFPPGTLHLVIVDPGVGTDRRILAIHVDGQFFLGPDNGVLAPAAARAGARVRAIEMGSLEALGLGQPSPTFHGRDVFAPLAGALASGSLPFVELGSPCRDWARPNWPGVERTASRVRGRVLLVDSFGNCFSNIDAISIVPYEVRSVTFGTHRLPWVRTYGDRPAGSDVALINAFGVLEAARVQGNASLSLGIAVGTAVEVGLGRVPPGA